MGRKLRELLLAQNFAAPSVVVYISSISKKQQLLFFLFQKKAGIGHNLIKKPFFCLMALNSVGDWKSNISLILQQTENNLEGRRPYIHSVNRSPVRFQPERVHVQRGMRDSSSPFKEENVEEIYDLKQDMSFIKKEIQKSAKKTELLLAEVEKLHKEMNIVKQRMEIQENKKEDYDDLTSWDSTTIDMKVANLFGLKDELFKTESLIRNHLLTSSGKNEIENYLNEQYDD